VHTRAVDIHDVLLVAALVHLLLALEDQLLARRREIGFGVVAAERDLPDAAEVGLTRFGGNGNGRRRLLLGAAGQEKAGENEMTGLHTSFPFKKKWLSFRATRGISSWNP
jgi:hypothetical protein